MALELVRMTRPKVAGVLAGTKHKAPILAEAIYLDTETSNNYNADTGEGVTWIYQWAFRWCRETAMGRTPEQLFEALEEVDRANGLTSQGIQCVIYIHNASYDLSYLLPYFRNRYGLGKILATAAHKIITFESGPWLVRCTYYLSNRSLYKWGADLKIKHGKKKGLIDYGVRRYQDSPLVRKDWIYQIYDVIALEECVLAELSAEHDTLRSIPLTSTGYVRRDGRRLAKAEKDRESFLRTRMNVEVYQANRFAFSGGLVHGNRFVIGDIVELTDEEGNAIGDHYDFRSDYPSQERARVDGFPCGPWEKYYEYDGTVRCTWEELDELRAEHCELITVLVGPVEIKKGETLPYLQESKCLLGADMSYKSDIVDNGRVLKSSGYTCLTFTELDWEILRKQYVMKDYKILRVFLSKRGPIPGFLKVLIDHYYKEKSRLKDLAASLPEGPEKEDVEISLTKAKNRLNGIYGMCATDPVRLEFSIDPETWEWEHTELTAELVEEKLAEYYKNRNNFMRYSIGVYTTAWARYDIMRFYWLIGPERFLYADTDSIFFKSSPEIREKIAEENRRREAAAIANGAFIEYDGKRVTYDAFESETYNKKPERIRRFVFLHAKAYAYERDDGSMKLTVAGVAKSDGKKTTREKELGKLENFEAGFVFRKCGSTAAVYLVGEPELVDVDGHKVSTAGGCVLVPTTKTLHDEFNRDTDFGYFEEMSKREVLGV